MNTNAQSEIFFLISSAGFFMLWILAIIFMLYLINIMHIFSRILKKVEKDADTISGTAKDIFLDIQESVVFQFLFGKKRKGRKATKTKS